MNKLFITILCLFFLFSPSFIFAQEKPLIIKELYIGMDVNDARNILVQLMGKEWTISPVGNSTQILADCRFGDEKIFGKKSGFPGTRLDSIVGDRGFAIYTKYDQYEGFISCDSDNRVTRISFSKEITNLLFSSSKIDAEDFAPAFWKNYNMPEFGWIMFGWQYASPLGYTITIKTDKFIDIKKDDIKEGKSIEKPKIKFE